MFLRYTHFGVGHPVALRKIVRGCFDHDESTVPTEAMDIDEGASNGEGHEEDAGEQHMYDDLGEDSEESEDELDGSEEGEDREQADEEFDDLGGPDELIEEDSNDYLYF
jgi:hypothetical protein